MTKYKTLASKMNKRITIETPVETPDGGGGYTLSWSGFATVWAQVKPIRQGREKLRDEQLEAVQSYQFIIRHLDGVSVKMRISYDGRFFNIRGVVNVDESGELLELLAEEGGAT